MPESQSLPNLIHKIDTSSGDPSDDDIWSSPETDRLIEQLDHLRRRMIRVVRSHDDRLENVVEHRKPSARNLLRYVSMRQQDLRSLQQSLTQRGLSSLGRCEANVLTSVNVVIELLCRLSGRERPRDESLPDTRSTKIDIQKSRKLLDQSTIDLFGQKPPLGVAHIMVTMPSEAANDRGLIRELVLQGMDCMRINCAHDEPGAWKKMIDHLHRVCADLDRECKVIMDLAGPKLRTGSIEPSVAVLKWRPKRDALGRTIAPARIWLRDETTDAPAPLPADATLPINANWFSEIQVGDEIEFTDTRDRRRRLRIVECGANGFWAEADRTAYLMAETPLIHRRRKKRSADIGRAGTLISCEPYVVLRRGERLILCDDFKIGSPAKYDDHGQVIYPATIGCTLPSVFRDLQRGERVLFDDGKIAASVEEVHERHAVLEVTAAAAGGTKLRADKGINLPDTNLHLDALTQKDIQDLAFVIHHADIVGYSFVRRASDVEILQDQLNELGRPDMPIVLKIENRQAFERLPSLLLSAMRSASSGVMIARGDLAVELGWQRLAEVQEEILWMCEAAHMPVVWATQVLESLTKTGFPSRAEITDAAMSVRAECVMLNKGPHILEAVRVLGDILRRMQDHQVKKRPMLRRLHLADDLMPTRIVP